jgi:serine/threonine protein kinase
MKPENILLTSPDSNTDLKIADFGLAVFADADSKTTGYVGSDFFISPDVICNNLTGRRYGCEVDMWSIGVITFLLLSGECPFLDLESICKG